MSGWPNLLKTFNSYIITTILNNINMNVFESAVKRFTGLIEVPRGSKLNVLSSHQGFLEHLFGIY